MGEAQTAVPKDHPMMIAWEAFKKTESFENSKHWAMRIAPMIHPGDPLEREKVCELMPYRQREGYVEGSLWAMFMAGWMAHAEFTEFITGIKNG